MDETFQLRARRMLGPRQPAPLDYHVLSASLIAQQATSAAAQAQARHDRAAAAPPEPDLLIETLLAGPAWQDAVAVKRGSFNKVEVKRRSGTP